MVFSFLGLHDKLGLLEASRSRKFYDALMKNVIYSYDLVQAMALRLIEGIDFPIDESERERFVCEVLADADNINTAVQHRVSFQIRVIGVKFADRLLPVLKELCMKCRQRTENASLASIASGKPIHTLLNAICSLFPYLPLNDVTLAEFIRNDVIDLCLRVAELVQPVLNSNAPEGMDAMDEEDCSEKDIPEHILEQKFESQLLVVASWRIIKSVSGILATAVMAPDELLLNQWKDLLPLLKDYFWNQLTVCRHKGAFEFATRGFQTISDRFRLLFADDLTNQLNPLQWLAQIIEAVRGGVGKLYCDSL